MEHNMHHDNPTNPAYALLCVAYYAIIDVLTSQYPTIDFPILQIHTSSHWAVVIDTVIKVVIASVGTILTHKYLHRKKK